MIFDVELFCLLYRIVYCNVIEFYFIIAQADLCLYFELSIVKALKLFLATLTALLEGMCGFVKQVLEITSKYGFILNKDKALCFGPLTLLLAKNINNEWLTSTIIQSNTRMFLYESSPNGIWQEDCNRLFHQILQLVGHKMPFVLVSKLTNLKCQRNESSDSPVQPRTNAYRCLCFVSPKESQQYFYHLQTTRKIWWRKFAREPERFHNKEIKGGENEEGIEILAEFGETSEVVEMIYNLGSKPLQAYNSVFEVKAGRKKILPHVIEMMCLERPATLTYMYDAFQQLPSRSIMRFHNRLAPYKAAVAIDCDDGITEISQLAEFISVKLCREGLHTLLSAVSQCKKVAESQFTSLDLLGVPYTIVIKRETLKNGIAGLRSRDTTLQEQVHISKVTAYLKQLLIK